MLKTLLVLVVEPSSGTDSVYWAPAAPWKVRDAVLRGGDRGSAEVRAMEVMRVAIVVKYILISSWSLNMVWVLIVDCWLLMVMCKFDVVWSDVLIAMVKINMEEEFEHLYILLPRYLCYQITSQYISTYKYAPTKSHITISSTFPPQWCCH